MATVVHFEIPANDVDRAQKFYGELFGWKIEKYPGLPMDYWMISTGRQEGEMGVDGGMLERQQPEQHITIYIDVPSVDEYLGKVASMGGQVVVPKSAVPGMGYYAVCLDTENNGFGLWENDPKAQ